MFNNNEGLMQAWSKSGGSKNSKEYRELDATSKRQYDRMVAVGHNRKSTSFLAVADYMSQNGKGDFSTYRNALVAARQTGADEAELSDTQAGSMAAYRGSGRGDIVGQIRAHEAANIIEKRDINGRVVTDANGNAVMEGTIFGATGASRQAKLVSMQKAWAETSAAKVHRDGIKVDRDDDGQVILDPATRMATQPVRNRGGANEDLGMIAYQMHLTASNTKTLVNDDGHPVLDARGNRQLIAGDGQNLSSALEKFNDMEQRAQNQVKDTLIGAAEDFRLQQYQQAVRNGVEPQEKFQNRIVNINQAKDMFGMLPGGRFTATNSQQNSQLNNNQSRPPESNEERLRSANNINDETLINPRDDEAPDINASDDTYDDAAD